jgi:hypothetical protein
VAAYAAGLLTLEGALQTAVILGQAGAKCEGAMAHTQLTRHALASWPSEENLCIAAVNGVMGVGSAGKAPTDLLSVTLSGSSERVQWWLAIDSNAKSLAPPHAWHHPVFGASAALAVGAAFKSLPKSTKPGRL